MLHTLVEYAELYLPESEPGFKTREVRWCIEISTADGFLGIIPLGDGMRGQDQSRCPDMHGMNAGGKSHFLVETAQTITLLFKDKESEKTRTRVRARHKFFVELLSEASRQTPVLAPLTRVLADESQLAEIKDALSEAKGKPADWIGWRVNGADLRCDQTVQQWWREWRRNDLGNSDSEENKIGKGSDNEMICILTGDSVKPLPTHPKITGLSGVGGLSMGDVMVGFDKAAFGSYGLDQSANAAMSVDATQKYVDALNDLIRNQSRKLGNLLVAHWFKEQIPLEHDPLAFIQELQSTEEAAALGAAKRLLNSIRSGERADLGRNRFYALTLSGAAGRIMVRDWMEGGFEDLVRNVIAWFSDLAIVTRNGGGQALDPKFMAVCGALVRDLKELPGPTVAALWKTAVQQLPVPRPFMAQALVRFRSDLVRDEPHNHARMGLIKAYFVRLQPGGDSTMTAYLNPDHPSAAYHCGRLLAVLANLQRAALGDVGAGVVQRYYVAASQTPGLILGRLTSNARNHLGKLETGLAYWYESQIADVMSRLEDSAPRILDLEGQGLFALGYYQQLASLRASNKNSKTESTTEKGETE